MISTKRDVFYCMFLDAIRLLVSLCCFIGDVFTCIFRPNKTRRLPPVTNPILLKSGVQLAEELRNGKLNSRQIVEAYMDRISAVNPLLNAAVRFNEDAIKEANELNDQHPTDLQPLLGIPFSLKDDFQVKGRPLTRGLAANLKVLCTETDEVVENIYKSGAIQTVVTNVPEFCMWYDSSNKLYGATNNPYDLTRIPGGSSGGEGSLIASAGSLFGIGSDIGGSVRVPAFFCGIYAHKPSPQVVPLSKSDKNPLSNNGPMCRYIDDMIPMLKALAGANIVKLPKIDEPVDVKQLKVFYMLESRDPLANPIAPDARLPVEKAVAFFKGMGLECVQVDIPEFHHAFEIWTKALIEYEGKSFLCSLQAIKKDVNLCTEILKALIGKSYFTNKTLFMTVLLELEMWRKKRAGHENIREEIKDFKERFNNLLGDNSVFLYPTHSEVAPKHELAFNIFNAVYTVIFNVLEVPVTQVPMGLTCEGIPTGLQVAASPYNDHISIAVAKELDKAFGGWIPPS